MVDLLPRIHDIKKVYHDGQITIEALKGVTVDLYIGTLKRGLIHCKSRKVVYE